MSFKKIPPQIMVVQKKKKQYMKIFGIIMCILLIVKEKLPFLFSFSYYLKGENILTCKRSGDNVYWNYDVPKCESK